MELKSAIRILRPQQWIKNGFVFAPVIFSFKLFDYQSVFYEILGAAIFCFCSSFIYILNDLRDQKSDQLHVRKRLRPLASGAVTRSQAIGILIFLLALMAVGAVFAGLSAAFWIVLGLYALFGVSYNFGLKHVPLIELFIVAGGYILRLMAGCAVIDATPSPWILAAVGTLALLIVTGKRRAEMAENGNASDLRQSLKGYNITFLDSMITMLATTTAVTYLLFTTSDYAINRYHKSYFLLTSVFVFYGVLRYMQIVKVMEGADDPTTLALTDLGLRCAVLGWIISCTWLIYG